MAEREAAARSAFEDRYAGAVSQFAEAYDGFTDKELEGIGAYHGRLIQKDARLSALSFPEVARRMFGDDGLEARRTKGDADGNAKGSQPRNGHASQPSGSPIPSRSTGGGAPKKFEPGPGKGVGDVTDHLRKAGAWSRVVEQKK